jgi:hypothetical protein
MVVVELVYTGRGGLEQLVDQTAVEVEYVFDRHTLKWSPSYPVTLRESLGLGVRQQMIGGVPPSPGGRGGKKAYRMWLALPEGGLRAWTAELTDRILKGCGASGKGTQAQVRRELQKVLVCRLGPCLERAQLPSILMGSIP